MPTSYAEGSDTTHASHPVLDLAGIGSSTTFSGRLDNQFVDVAGFPTFQSDADFFEFEIGTGVNELPFNSQVTITFSPQTYFARVGFRIDEHSNLIATQAYPGSNGTAIRHEPSSLGPFTVTFSILGIEQYFVGGTAVDPRIEFQIVGGGPPSGSFPYTPIDYTISINRGLPSLVDLVISTANVDTSPKTAGDLVRVSYTVRNQGTATPPDFTGTPSGVYLSTDATYGIGDIPLHTQVDGVLAGGTSLDVVTHREVTLGGDTYTLGAKLPQSLVTGTFYIIVVTDHDNRIVESDDTNNWIALPVSVTGLPQGNATPYIGTAANERMVVPTTGASIPNGGGGDDYIAGASATDVIYGGLGRDVMLGNGGSDMLLGDADFMDDTGSSGSADQLIGGTGKDNLYGGPGDDYFNGEADDDWIHGQSGNDLGYGGAGDDHLFGDEGNDQLWGGTSATLNPAWFGAPISVNLDGINGAAIALQTYSVGGLVQATGTGNDQLWGGAGDDQLYGQDGSDMLVGEIGNDQLDGGLGIDWLEGGPGNDTYHVDTFRDVIIELAGGGTDSVISSDSYIFHANVENVTLTGTGNFGVIGNELANIITGNTGGNGIDAGLGNDTIASGDGDDTIIGGAGDDSMTGGDGIDTYFVDSLGDAVVETDLSPTAYDTIWTTVTLTLPAGVEILILNGGVLAINGIGNDGPTDATPNLMLGNNAANTLTTFGGDDIILGRDGNDVINSGGGQGGVEIISGGVGLDTLTSGGGHDFFAYENINEGGDTITDFSTAGGDNLDILDLRPMFFTTFTNTGGVTTVAQAVASGHLTFTQAGADTQVFADADGGANNNVLLATLNNTTAASVQALTLI
jgi:Ca2+-binding RTX toxin-like protein